MNAKTLEAVRKHGETLLEMFPNATERDPVALCKKLRRVETAARQATTDYCNGKIQTQEWEPVSDKFFVRLCALLGLSVEAGHDMGLIVNTDARGYALKVDGDTESFKQWQEHRLEDQKPPLHTDWGSNGIIAPDLTEE